MIQNLRKWSENFIFKFILGLTALSFVVAWGAGGVMSFLSDDQPVLSTSGEKMRASEFSTLLNKEMQRMQKRFSSSVDIRDFMRSGFAISFAKDRLDQMTVSAFAKDAQIDYSMEQVIYLIHRDPAFQDTAGNFSRNLLNARLLDYNMSEEEFLDRVRQQAVYQQVLAAPASQAYIPRILTDLLYMARNERRSFDYVHIPFASVTVTETPKTAALQEIYEEQREKFVFPEYRSVQVIELPKELVTKRLGITETQVKEYYDAHREDYLVPEKRSVRQYIFRSEKEADDFIKAYQAKKALAAIENELPLNAHKSDLGFVEESEISPLLSDPVFVAAKGAAVGPIAVDTDFQVLIVLDIQKQRQLSFEAVKKNIAGLLERNRMDDVYTGLYQELDDFLAAGKPFDTIAKHFGVLVKKVERLTYDDTKGLPALAVSEVFELDTGMETGIIEEKGGFMVVRLDSIVPARQKTFEEAKEELIAVWKGEQRIKIAAELSDKLTQTFTPRDKKTQALSTKEKLLASYPSDLISSAFGHRSLKTVTRVPVKDGFFVYRLTAIKDADLSGQQTSLQVLNGALLDTAKQDFAASFLRDLRKTYEARIDDKIFVELLTRMGYLSSEKGEE